MFILKMWFVNWKDSSCLFAKAECSLQSENILFKFKEFVNLMPCALKIENHILTFAYITHFLFLQKGVMSPWLGYR